MSVHKGISDQLRQKNREISLFIQLDKEREAAITAAVDRCEANEHFTTDRINELSSQINELAKQGSIPTRTYVTNAMIEEYVQQRR
ncbi:DUF2533 family protein [Guptibacillus hwajinpoensis]|uniref:DUF2533 family protein n=1 Tax=Guptibacillus hwajinpoensis TaxID=208199 RepID=A0ABU0K2D7_9BACL|nr:DUF2533 family protein [Alkalihalobacillus hemicentroti]MDQ0482322.1 hypothetical protein [Alkalihalobacillus hemicentroti]